MKTALLFPGQGAQYPGMGKDFFENYSSVKELFSLASDSTGMDLKKLLFEGTEEDLKKTDNTQVAITLANLAAATVLRENGITADIAAGFSLGEFAALAEAGVISEESVFKLVQIRGNIMEKVSRSLDSDSGNPGMAAVIGLSFPDLSALLGKIEGAFVANYNSPVQTVVAGTASGLDAAEPVCKEAGARRFIRLKVSGPFHSPLMQKASEEFAEALKEFDFADPKIPVYSNVTGGLIESGEQAKELAVKQIVSTVCWVDEEQAMIEAGVERCIESGPGTVLGGLWKSVTKDINCFPAGKLEQIEQIKE